jgi:hypothetical protein
MEKREGSKGEENFIQVIKEILEDNTSKRRNKQLRKWGTRNKVKVKISLLQAVEARRVARGEVNIKKQYL